MAAVHHFELPGFPVEKRNRQTLLLWLKDAAAAVGLVVFIASCMVLMDAVQGLFD